MGTSFIKKQETGFLGLETKVYLNIEGLEHFHKLSYSFVCLLMFQPS